MRVVDDCLREIDGNLGFLAEMIIYPNFDKIDLLLTQFVDVLLDLIDGFDFVRNAFHSRSGGGITVLAGKSPPGGVNAGVGGPSATLLRANFESLLVVASHADDGGDPVRGIGPELVLEVLASVVLGVLNEALHISQMSMKINDAGHDILARQLSNLRVRIGLDFALGNPGNAAVGDLNPRSRLRRFAGPIDESHIGENPGFSEQTG